MKERFFDIAKECSYKSDYHGNAKIGAVAVFKGSIIAKSCNSDKTSPAQSHYNQYRFEGSDVHYYPPRLHAEMRLVAKIKYLDIDFNKITIYVYRELKDGSAAMARPCAACTQALIDLGIKHVCYSTPTGYCEEWYK